MYFRHGRSSATIARMPVKEIRTLPFLLQRVAQALHAWHSDFRKLHISVLAVRMLAVLSANDKAGVGELAEATCVDQPTVSHILRRLARAELVKKTRNGEDSREVKVTLTRKGRRVAKRALETVHEHDRALAHGLSAAQLHTLRGALDT